MDPLDSDPQEAAGQGAVPEEVPAPGPAQDDEHEFEDLEVVDAETGEILRGGRSPNR
jgi:hypothetical protein